MSKKRLGVCLWCMSSDINSVTYKGERKRRAISFNNIKSEEFSFFIHNMELLDVLTSGKKFTWISVDGLSMSRLDCFLIFKDLFLGSNISLQWVGSVEAKLHDESTMIQRCFDDNNDDNKR